MTKKGVILPLGANGDADDSHVLTPAIMFKDGMFWLYYTGHDGSAPFVCLALSKDGVNFTKKGVVLPLGSAGDIDENRTTAPAIMFKDGMFWLYYTAKDGTNFRVCLALSKDGINFTKKGVVIPLGANGDFDDIHTYTQAIMFKDGMFWLYYTGNDGTSYRIGLALSKDGINFTKKGVVIPLGAAGQIDDGNTYSQTILFKDGTFFLYYVAQDNTIWRLGLAVSKDGINFTKKGIVIPLGASGESDEIRTYEPAIFLKDARFWIYYSCYDGTNYRTNLALSKDGIIFT